MSENTFTLGLTDEADVKALRDEIDALRVETVEIMRGSSSEVTRVFGIEPQMLARALDHVRNSSKDSEDLRRERDHLLSRLRVPPFTYRLRSWEFTPEEQDRVFFSYTGPYAKEDRLVTFGGHEFRVFDVLKEATNTEPGVLLVVRA